MPAPELFVVRSRTLPAHVRPGRRAVYDVTEGHTDRAVPWGVHTCPDRAAAHAARLTRRAQATAAAEDRAEVAERARVRARLTAKREQTKPQEARPPRRRRRPLPPRTSPWTGTLRDAADIIMRVRAAGGAAAYTCADPNACWRTGGRSPHTIRIAAPTAVTMSPGDTPPPIGR
jgi:hypothetical protein